MDRFLLPDAAQGGARLCPRVDWSVSRFFFVAGEGLEEAGWVSFVHFTLVRGGRSKAGGLHDWRLNC